ETAADGALARAISALPQAVQAFVRVCAPSQADALPLLGAVLFEGDADALARAQLRWAQREGAIVRIESLNTAQSIGDALIDLTALMHEQSLSTNTAAAGGNAQLMTLG
ncbi:MAG: L-glutamate gamma-semialdehyde dehydrogenase, partial [Thiomonas sp.]